MSMTTGEKLMKLSEKLDLMKYTYRQIAEMIGVTHPQTVRYYMYKLVELGKLDQRYAAKRAKGKVPTKELLSKHIKVGADDIRVVIDGKQYVHGKDAISNRGYVRQLVSLRKPGTDDMIKLPSGWYVRHGQSFFEKVLAVIEENHDEKFGTHDFEAIGEAVFDLTKEEYKLNNKKQ